MRLLVHAYDATSRSAIWAENPYKTPQKCEVKYQNGRIFQTEKCTNDVPKIIRLIVQEKHFYCIWQA